MTTTKRVFITGGSGLLGREIVNKFRDKEWKSFGTAFSRAEKYGLLKVDLNDTTALVDAVTVSSPSIIIHCAAQRSPDAVENQYEDARKLNVDVTKTLAQIAVNQGIPIIYISTDYVFDGKNPPYKESDKPNPTNKYGVTKLDGEKVIMETNPSNIILRIPVLYGNVEYPGESAVTCLLDSVRNIKQQDVSDYEIRWPAHTRDIAAICFELSNKKLEDPSISGIFQWSGQEGLTKYQMVQILGEEMKLSIDHIHPDGEPSKTVARPFNCQLDCTRLKNLGIGEHTNFREGIKECLQKFMK